MGAEIPLFISTIKLGRFSAGFVEQSRKFSEHSILKAPRLFRPEASCGAGSGTLHGPPFGASDEKHDERWLAIRPQDSHWLFPNDAGNPYYDRNLLRRRVWPVCDQLSIPHFGWHSLRHTFTTYGGNSGVPLPVLQSLLGHTSMETTMIYTHPLLEA
jgi:site-specific recombinase XerC